jgi:hypothetical protein
MRKVQFFSRLKSRNPKHISDEIIQKYGLTKAKFIFIVLAVILALIIAVISPTRTATADGMTESWSEIFPDFVLAPSSGSASSSPASALSESYVSAGAGESVTTTGETGVAITAAVSGNYSAFVSKHNDGYIMFCEGGKEDVTADSPHLGFQAEYFSNSIGQDHALADNLYSTLRSDAFVNRYDAMLTTTGKNGDTIYYLVQCPKDELKASSYNAGVIDAFTITSNGTVITAYGAMPTATDDSVRAFVVDAFSMISADASAAVDGIANTASAHAASSVA